MMKAAVFHAPGRPLAIETLAIPRPRPNDVIIKVHRCGVCSSDLHMTSGHDWDLRPGTVPGHEFAGEIVELGADVASFRLGDIITGMPALGCELCEGCANGVWVHCENLESNMGGFGEFMRVPAKAAMRLPTTFSAADGALVEPFAVGRYAVRVAQCGALDRILVLGAGPIGLTTIFWAKQAGARRVVAAARSRKGERLALEMGCDAFVQTGEADAELIMEALNGRPQAVFECVGAPGMLAKSIDYVAPLGRVVSMGFCVSPDPVVPALAAVKGISLSFPMGYALSDFEYVADHMLSGEIDPKIIISSVISLDQLPEAFEDLRLPNNQTKVQVVL